MDEYISCQETARQLHLTNVWHDIQQKKSTRLDAFFYQSK